MASSPVRRFIIKNSGGLIRDESQAMMFIVIVFVLSIVFSIFTLYQTFSSHTNTNSEIIEPQD